MQLVLLMKIRCLGRSDTVATVACRWHPTRCHVSVVILVRPRNAQFLMVQQLLRCYIPIALVDLLSKLLTNCVACQIIMTKTFFCSTHKLLQSGSTRITAGRRSYLAHDGSAPGAASGVAMHLEVTAVQPHPKSLS